MGRGVHIANVANVDAHVANMTNPIAATTLAESTTRYDLLGRTVATTQWLVARGSIDPSSPPIAGLDGVSAADGLTTQYLYDNNLVDGVGLNSPGGMPYTRMASSGTSSVSLATALTKLASTSAGGAGISFTNTTPGQATVVINSKDEISFNISDFRADIHHHDRL